MSSPKSSESCQERSGFLFEHDCARPVGSHCTNCSKATCEEHTHGTGRQRLCTGCYRAALQGQSDVRLLEPVPRVQDLSPMLFSAYYYQGYGYFGRGGAWEELMQDPNDFTEADGASLRRPEDSPFEKDMQGS